MRDEQYRKQARELVEAYIAEQDKQPLIERRISDPTLRAYLEAALWASTDDAGDPLDDNYSIDDIADEAIRQAEDEVDEFAEKAGDMLDDFNSEDVGHNFWLTRNRHGAGFWDGDFEPYGDALTELAHDFGESDAYVGDDGLIYFFPHR